MDTIHYFLSKTKLCIPRNKGIPSYEILSHELIKDNFLKVFLLVTSLAIVQNLTVMDPSSLCSCLIPLQVFFGVTNLKKSADTLSPTCAHFAANAL